MTRWQILATSVAASAVSVAPASAESLMDALALAYQTNPEIASERASLQALDETFVQARSVGLPNASSQFSLSATDSKSERQIFTGGGSTSNFEDSDTTGNSALSVSAGQDFYRGGQTRAAMDAAEANILAGRANLLALEQAVLFDAVPAFVDVRRDLEVVRIRMNNVEVLNRQLQAAQDRFEVGDVTRTDVAQAEARVSAARSALAAAQADLAVTRANYARVIGQSPGELQPEPPLPPLPATVDEAVSLALESNPNAVSARLREDAARAGVRQAEGAFRPTVGWQLQAVTQRDLLDGGVDNDAVTATARATLPLFTGGLNSANKRQALANENAARLDVRDIERQVTELTVSAFAQYISANAQIDASEQQVRASEIAFEGVEEEARVGLRTTLDVLDAEQEVLDARLALVDARRNAYLAGFGLIQSVGQLSVPNLGLDVPEYDPTSNYSEIRKKYGLFEVRHVF